MSGGGMANPDGMFPPCPIVIWHSQRTVTPAGFEPATHGLTYHYSFHCGKYICGLDYIFTVSGVARIVSTEPA